MSFWSVSCSGCKRALSTDVKSGSQQKNVDSWVPWFPSLFLQYWCFRKCLEESQKRGLGVIGAPAQWSWWELAVVSWRSVGEEGLHHRARRRHYGGGDHQQDQLQLPFQDSLDIQWTGCLYDLITSNLPFCRQKMWDTTLYKGRLFFFLFASWINEILYVSQILSWLVFRMTSCEANCPVLCRQPFALSNFFMGLD